MYIALIGMRGALLGSIVGAVTSYFVQKNLLHAEVQRNLHSNLLEKRIAALQYVNIAVDFSFGNIGKTDGGPLSELFVKISQELPTHIAFLPDDIRSEARKLMFSFFSGLRDGEVHLREDEVSALRDKVLTLIDENYKLYGEATNKQLNWPS